MPPSLLLLLLLPLAQDPPSPGGARLERDVLAMGTRLGLTIHAPDRPTALAASEAAVRAVEEVEARLSTWRPDSELARLNGTPPGTPFTPSPALAADLQQALRWRATTGGAFEPVLAALVDAWGLRTGGRRPSPGALERALDAAGPAAITFDLPHRVVRHHAAAGVEEGGFGKGIALDAAAAAILATGADRAWLDFGGQVLAVGRPPATPVALADPRDRGRGVLELSLTRGSLATSANSERGIVVAGEPLGHLLDPRTGRPAPDVGSFTVLALDATAADCLSTGCAVLGPDAALALAHSLPAIDVVVLEFAGDRLRVRATGDLAARLVPLLPGLTVEPYAPPAERNLP